MNKLREILAFPPAMLGTLLIYFGGYITGGKPKALSLVRAIASA